MFYENYDWQQYFDLTAQRTATVNVAASNASADSRRMSDYLCDGVADDVQIQAAIDAVAAVGGGTVRLSEGLYTLAAGLTSGERISIIGAGIGRGLTPHGTTLMPAVGAGLTLLTVTGVADNEGLYLGHLLMRGVAAQSNDGVRLNNVQNALLDNVAIDGMRAGGGPLTGRPLWVTDGFHNHFRSCFFGPGATNGDPNDNGVLVEESAAVDRYHQMTDCYAEDTLRWEASGSTIKGLRMPVSADTETLQIADGAQNVQVSDLQCGTLQIGAVAPVSEVQVVGARLRRVLLENSSRIQLDDVVSQGSTAVAFDVDRGSDIELVNCRARSSGGVGFHVRGVTPARVTLTACKALSTTGDGLLVETGTDVVVDGIRVDTPLGLGIDSRPDGVQLISPRVDNPSGTAIDVYGAHTLVSDPRIENGAAGGIRMRSTSDRSIVSGGRIRNPGGNGILAEANEWSIQGVLIDGTLAGSSDIVAIGATRGSIQNCRCVGAAKIHAVHLSGAVNVNVFIEGNHLQQGTAPGNNGPSIQIDGGSTGIGSPGWGIHGAPFTAAGVLESNEQY